MQILSSVNGCARLLARPDATILLFCQQAVLIPTRKGLSSGFLQLLVQGCGYGGAAATDGAAAASTQCGTADASYRGAGVRVDAHPGHAARHRRQGARWRRR